MKRRIYYAVKPFLPWRIRMALRRVHAAGIRRRFRDSWPIDPNSGQPPPGWPGWPEGRRFAFVLTHDVEGPDGLAKCRRLAELELSLGVRSVFNFIPEGPYGVSDELRQWLVQEGFEVGVHDLRHDGKLFNSHEAFNRNARQINLYLSRWQAVGFRAGFMLRNLEWYHQLDVEYDASTFDTDPFEIQPDGAGTIFPFWVPASPQADSPNGGYVELPYTLVQDSTLFTVLRESTPDIWFRKVDWIAEHGGMALLNLHPDYIRFDGERPTARTFPVTHYRDLLNYVREKYGAEGWQALPRDVARYSRSFFQLHPTTPLDAVAAPPLAPPPSIPMAASETNHSPPPKIVMLVENNYPQDPRVRNEANLLTSAGYHISVIALARSNQPRHEIIDGVSVFRMPALELFKKTEAANAGAFARLVLSIKAMLGYAFEYAYFTGGCLFYCIYIWLRHGLDVIHAHNPPDTPFLVGLPFRLIGKKYVFDHHDLSPELYRSRYNRSEGFQTRILRFFEWGSLKIANMTIATNESYKRIQIERGGRDPESIFIVRNGPNPKRMEIGNPTPRLRDLNKKVLVYIGSLNPQDGVDYLLRSLGHLRHGLGRSDFHCVIMGSGDSLDDLRALSTRLGLNDCVELTGFVSDEDLQSNLAAADICVDPDPSSPLNDVSTWIKIMEYMAAAKPIVTFDLKETHYSAQDAAVYVKPNDEKAFAEALAGLMDAPEEDRRRMGDFGRQRVERELQWSVVGQNLVRAYEYLLGRPAPKAPDSVDTSAAADPAVPASSAQ